MRERLKSFFQRPRVRGFLRHPASAVFWFTLASLVIRENYPISHYPMYSGFSDNTWYLYFKDPEGDPIEAKKLLRNTVARCKKRYGSLREEYCKETGKEGHELGPEDHEEIGGRLIEELKRKAPDSVKKKPKYAPVFENPLTLVRVDIVYRDGVFSTSEQDIATR